MEFSDVSGGQRQQREIDDYPRERDTAVDIALAPTPATEDEDNPNPVVWESCRKWSRFRLLLKALSILPGMVVYSVLGSLIGVLILPILQWNLLTDKTVDVFKSVDAMILTLRRMPHHQFSNSRTYTIATADEHTTNLTLQGRLQSMCNGNNLKKLTNVCSFIGCIVRKIVYNVCYVLLLIIMFLSTMGMGGMVGIYLGIVLGYAVSVRVTDRLMKGEMRTDTLYKLTEERLVKYGVLKVIVHKRTAQQSVRQVDGCILFYGLLGLNGLFAVLLAGNYLINIIILFSYESAPNLSWVLTLMFLLFNIFMVYNVNSNYITKLAEIEQEFIESAKTRDEEETAQELPEIESAKTRDEEETAQGGEEELQEWIDKYNEMLEIAQNFQNVPLTEEEENWVRFAYLLVDEGTIWVKGLFMGNIQEKGNTLQVLLETNRKMLKKKGPGGAGMNSSQLRLMFPTATEVTDSADEFDLTLLVRLIGILNLSTEPDGGWNSDKEPTNPDPETYHHPLIPLNKKIQANNLLRMRLMRNRLYAHDCKMTKEEYDVEFPKVMDILVSFGATVEKINEDFKKLNMTPESRKHFAQRVTTLFSGDRPDVERLKEKTIANHNGIHQHDGDYMNVRVRKGTKIYRKKGLDGSYVLTDDL